MTVAQKTADEIIKEAFDAFDAWVAEHEEVQELPILDQVDAYSRALRGEAVTEIPQAAIAAHAKALCKSWPKDPNGCAALCMDRLGDIPKEGCRYAVEVHGKRSIAALQAAAPFMQQSKEFECLRAELFLLRSAGTFADGIEAAARAVKELPCRLGKVSDGYGTYFPNETIEPSREEYIFAILSLKPKVKP